MAFTRRALIAGAGTTIASAALAAPYVNAAHPAETITDRLERLTQELSAAMAEYQGGKFKVVVEPGADGDVTLVKMTPEHLLRHAAGEIRQAMADEGKDDFMVFVMDRPGKERIARMIDFAADAGHRDIA